MVGLLLLAWFLIKWFKFCHYIYIIKKFQMIKLLGFQGIRYADLVFFFPSQSLDNLLMGCCFSLDGSLTPALVVPVAFSRVLQVILIGFGSF